MRILGEVLNLSNGEEGQTVIEYVLVVVLISFALVFAFNVGSPADAIEAASQFIANIIANAI